MSLTTFASRQPAAYIAGTVFDEPITTSTKMLEKANLNDWNVRLRTIETDARSKTETFEVIRDNPFDGGLDRLGVVGERYGTVQNEQAFAMFDDLSPQWEAAGQFRNGTLVYGQAQTGESILIDPNGVADEIRPLVVVSTTHNGSGALNIGRTALRLDCLNMFQAMFGDLQHSIKVRHTLSIETRLKSIRLAWKQNNAYFAALADEANALFQKKCTDKQFFAIVGHLMGDRPEENVKGSQTKFDNNLELFSEAWRGQPNEKVYGTMWGAYQALVERNQWGRKTQDTDNGVENFAMAGMGLDVTVANFRQNALDLVRA